MTGQVRLRSAFAERLGEPRHRRPVRWTQRRRHAADRTSGEAEVRDLRQCGGRHGGFVGFELHGPDRLV